MDFFPSYFCCFRFFSTEKRITSDQERSNNRALHVRKTPSGGVPPGSALGDDRHLIFP